MQEQTKRQEEQEMLCLIGLSKIEGLGPITVRKVIKKCGGAREVFRASQGDLRAIPRVGKQVAAAIRKKEVLRQAETEMSKLYHFGGNAMSYRSALYPKNLKSVADSPLVLYYKGDTKTFQRPSVAIVGTRKPTEYGRRMAKEFSEYFASIGINVVSGLASGIDGEAHHAAVCAGGTTTAVLGHGLDTVYPRMHAGKAVQIVDQGGSLVTEYSWGAKMEPHNFPSRNRIISGMCSATVVIEATQRGGALITARAAFDQNREVYAIPGNVGQASSVGCNQLIRDQVAKLVLDPKEIVEDLQHLMFWRGKKKRRKDIRIEMTPGETIVYRALIDQRLRIDELQKVVERSVGDLRSTLISMELKGLVEHGAGDRYVAV